MILTDRKGDKTFGNTSRFVILRLQNKKYQIYGQPEEKRVSTKLYVMDSTTISLNSQIPATSLFVV